MFETNPVNSGYIECDKNAPVAQQFCIYSGSECTAEPYPGFEFVSWQENLGGNSTQLINATAPPSRWEPILNFLNINSPKPEATLSITKFGTFTANFRVLMACRRHCKCCLVSTTSYWLTQNKRATKTCDSDVHSLSIENPHF